MCEANNAGERSDSAFLVVFAGMVVSAAALILSIPPLFGAPEPYQVWMSVVFGALAVVFAIGVVRRRPLASTDT